MEGPKPGSVGGLEAGKAGWRDYHWGTENGASCDWAKVGVVVRVVVLGY